MRWFHSRPFVFSEGHTSSDLFPVLPGMAGRKHWCGHQSPPSTLPFRRAVGSVACQAVSLRAVLTLSVGTAFLPVCVLRWVWAGRPGWEALEVEIPPISKSLRGAGQMHPVTCSVMENQGRPGP